MTGGTNRPMERRLSRPSARRGTLLRILSSDALKLRRSMAIPLAILGPVGVVGLTALNFGLRYDFVTKQYAGRLWEGLIEDMLYLSFMALLLGMTLLASQLAGQEHQTRAWKQTLALPVSRLGVFASKLIVLVLLLALSCALLFGGTWLLGGLLGFGWHPPLAMLARNSFYPLPAGLACLALQYGLSVAFKNQAIPLTAGILGCVVGMYGMVLPDWIIWKWPLLLNHTAKPEWSVYAGLAGGALLFLLGCAHFIRKDVD